MSYHVDTEAAARAAGILVAVAATVVVVFLLVTFAVGLNT